MAVVINEFEVIAAPPTPEAAAKGAEKTDTPKAPPVPHDVVRIVRWHAGRAERVRAH